MPELIPLSRRKVGVYRLDKLLYDLFLFSTCKLYSYPRMKMFSEDFVDRDN